MVYLLLLCPFLVLFLKKSRVTMLFFDKTMFRIFLKNHCVSFEKRIIQIFLKTIAFEIKAPRIPASQRHLSPG